MLAKGQMNRHHNCIRIVVPLEIGYWSLRFECESNRNDQ